MIAKCTRRQLALPMELLPCRRRSRTRGLKDLAERLEAAIDRIASDETVSSEQLDFFVWKLLSAVDLLRRRLAEDPRLALAVLESGPQTLTSSRRPPENAPATKSTL
jgi:hypothetical protein